MLKRGFELISDEYLTEVAGSVRLWRHSNTGAELLSVNNSDENKCFGITLRTPPKDSTGVAHILEHSVLCGSEKFPVKEPFVELLKGSLQTFLNAFTFPDKTCYPVASTNLQDFYNLVDVYIDAVFHPLISEDIFKQEGWHVDAAKDEVGEWSFKGVVYNEMKGVYSTPDSLLSEQSQQCLFSDMLYSLDSGGNPEEILNLKYEDFKKFHADYYHPSNARFFFWGDDSEDVRLEILEKELAKFQKKTVHSAVPLQQPYESPRLIECAYVASEHENRSMFTLNWLQCESADVETVLILEMLEHILLELPGSALRKVLIESGLGEDITGIGLETNLRQLYFSVGLKGLNPDDVTRAESLIFDTLASLLEEGIAEKSVEAAINSIEFDLRENNSGRFPRGLSAMVACLTTWLYNESPYAVLAWEKPLASIKKRIAAGEKVFEQAIEKWFLNNQHRVTVVLLPDNQLGEKRDSAERKKIDNIYQACSLEERELYVHETERLTLLQAKPDSEKALATIPNLSLEDLPTKNTPLPCAEKKVQDIPFLWHDLDTTGIAYINLLLPLQNVPLQLLPLIPLLSRVLIEAGTKRSDFVELGVNIAAKTGGLWLAPFLGTAYKTKDSIAYLAIGGKVVEDKIEELFKLMHEILLEPALDNKQRITQILLESKARLEYALVSGGHVAVSARLRAKYTITGWLEECTGGVSSLYFVRDLLDRVEKDWAGVLADLKELYNLIVNSNNSIWDCTCTELMAQKVQPFTAELTKALPQKDFALQKWSCPVAEAAEVFIAPSQVNFVGKAANLYALGYNYHGSANVIFKHLRMGYLWEKIRVQGGAYGAFSTLDRMSGTFVQVSYRDPSVSRTLQVYDATADYLLAFDPDAREMSRAIVGAIGDLDTYLLPDAKGSASLTRYLAGDTEDLRQKMRDEILSTSKKDFNDFAAVMFEAVSNSSICILGGAKAEAEAKDNGWKIERIL